MSPDSLSVQSYLLVVRREDRDEEILWVTAVREAHRIRQELLQ